MNARDLSVAVAAIVTATPLSLAQSALGQDTEKALHDAQRSRRAAKSRQKT